MFLFINFVLIKLYILSYDNYVIFGEYVDIDFL